MWNESEAKRGANKITICLIKFTTLKQKYGIPNRIYFYSNNCGEQNRNRFIISMWKYASFSLHLKITHRFLEKGHTDIGDNKHTCIENSKKGKTFCSKNLCPCAMGNVSQVRERYM